MNDTEMKMPPAKEVAIMVGVGVVAAGLILAGIVRHHQSRHAPASGFMTAVEAGDFSGAHELLSDELQERLTVNALQETLEDSFGLDGQVNWEVQVEGGSGDATSTVEIRLTTERGTFKLWMQMRETNPFGTGWPIQKICCQPRLVDSPAGRALQEGCR